MLTVPGLPVHVSLTVHVIEINPTVEHAVAAVIADALS